MRSRRTREAAGGSIFGWALRGALPPVLTALLLSALVPVMPAQARTWRVERDGSGDFTIIQDAIDAASSGDSVLVGPGRYGELRQQLVTGGTVHSILHPKVPDLTVIGSGVGQTILGPDPEVLVIDNVETMCVWVDYGITGLRLSGMTMENTWALMQLAEGAEFVDCEFLFLVQGNTTTSGAIRMVRTDGCRFERCEFVVDRLATSAIVSFVGGTNRNMTVVDCDFVHLSRGLAGMLIEVADNLLVRNCRFEGSNISIDLIGGTGFRIEDCVFRSEAFFGVYVESRTGTWATGRVDRCRFVDQGEGALSASVRSSIEGEGNVFGPSTFATIMTSSLVNLRLYNNHILHGTGWSVFVQSSLDSTSIDLRDNYWGTTDSTQIAEWISDGNDPCLDLQFCPRPLVEFVPFSGQPLPARSSSVGELKGAYGGQE